MFHNFKDLSGLDPKDFDYDPARKVVKSKNELPAAGVFCMEHPNASLIEDPMAGDTICSICGLVIQDRVIDVGAEWRTFDNDDKKVDPSRVGAGERPFLKNGLDLSTFIIAGDGQRSKRGGGQWSQLMTASDRTHLKALGDIEEMGNKLQMAQRDVDEAKDLCSKMRQTKVMKDVNKTSTFQGWTMDCLVPACVYLALKLGGVPRTSKEVCGVSQVAEKRIKKYAKIIIKTLNLDQNVTMKAVEASDCLPRFCSKLNPSLSSQVKMTEKVKDESKVLFKMEKTATAIARKATDLKLMGQRDAASVSAGAISMSAKRCGLHVSQRQIGEVVGLSHKTVHRSFMILHQNAHELIPSDVALPNQKEYPFRKNPDTSWSSSSLDTLD